MKKVIVLLFFSSLAHAGSPDGLSFLPTQTDAQKSFKTDVASGDYNEALADWNKAFSGSAFAATENGKAMRFYILAQNGLPVDSINRLIRETQASDLSPELISRWKPLLNSYVSEISPGSETAASWKRLFPSTPPAIKKKTQIAGVLARAQSLSNDDASKPQALWNIVTSAPQFGDTASALTALNSLKTLRQNQIGEDLILLATARVLYQKGDVNAAIEKYNAISKSSDFWIQALEERAWAHLRKKQHDDAVNDITTLLSSPLAPLAGSEPYFLSELTSLQVCDYPKILKTSKLFKERHHERLLQLEQLAKTGSNKALGPVMTAFDDGGFSLRSVGSNVEFMPHEFMRDQALSQAVRQRIELMTESRNIERLTDAAPETKSWIAENSRQAEKDRLTVLARMKSLANEELSEYRLTINKLHIVEAEVIQRLYVDESLKGKRAAVVQAKDDSNTLHFPYNDDEVWLDELDHYKSNVKDCPALPSLRGASL